MRDLFLFLNPDPQLAYSVLDRMRLTTELFRPPRGSRDDRSIDVHGADADDVNRVTVFLLI